jgi:hypothetical protein
MKKVYCQPYTKGNSIQCWYYKKVPKGVFKYDQIRVRLNEPPDIWITPDEAADLIRAISAGLHHWLVDNTKRIIKAKSKSI